MSVRSDPLARQRGWLPLFTAAARFAGRQRPRLPSPSGVPATPRNAGARRRPGAGRRTPPRRHPADPSDPTDPTDQGGSPRDAGAISHTAHYTRATSTSPLLWLPARAR